MVTLDMLDPINTIFPHFPEILSFLKIASEEFCVTRCEDDSRFNAQGSFVT